MKAIILVAGMGSRLQPLTNNIPKCMVPVDGQPILVRALNRLNELKIIDEVFLVVGYLAEYIKKTIGSSYLDMKISYIENDKYESTNNVYSLYLTCDRVNDGCILLEGDIIFDGEILSELQKSEGDCCIVGTKYNRESMNGTIVFTNKRNEVNNLVIKKHQDTSTMFEKAYKTVNIYKFNKYFWTKKFVPYLKTYIQTGDLNSYYELVLGSLIYLQEDKIQLLEVSEDSWTEIDDVEDLRKYEQGHE